MAILILLLIVVIIILLVSIIFPEEIKATRERDPAARNTLEILLLYPGLHAVIVHRIAHFLWNKRIPFFPRAFSQFGRFFTGIEIHPGATIDKGLFIDHGMGVVIGETSIIGKNVTLFQGVTLGGTGKETGKRHPTLKDNIVVGTGAKVLGNITIGSNSYIGANAVVIRDVPPNSTVVGIPGKVTKQDGRKIDKLMDHIHVLDPVMQNMAEITRRLETLEEKAKPKK
jgi:serine O-acetyltransferase